jgi:hypothetical protein
MGTWFAKRKQTLILNDLKSCSIGVRRTVKTGRDVAIAAYLVLKNLAFPCPTSCFWLYHDESLPWTPVQLESAQDPELRKTGTPEQFNFMYFIAKS